MTPAKRPRTDKDLSPVPSGTRESDSIVDDDDWTDGDLEVITSDNVRFRVPSHILFAAR